MGASQQNERFRSSLFYLLRDFYNRHEIATQSCETNRGRLFFKQLDGDVGINRAVESQVSFVQLQHRIIEKRYVPRLLNFGD